MEDGTAIIHINGVEYPLVEAFTGPNSGAFQNLVSRVDDLVTGTNTQTQRFDILIGGNRGQLIVRPSQLVSAAVVFVPAVETQIY